MRYIRFLLILLFLHSCNLVQNDEPSKNLIGDSGSVIILPAYEQLNIGYQIKKNGKKYIAYGLPYVEADQVIIIGKYKVKVLQKDFGESRIEILNSNLVQPKLADRERASAEYLKVRSIVKKISDQYDFNFHFISPIDDVITSNYGKQRFINGEKRSPHMALDIRGSIGTKIFAPKKGKVVMAENHFYGGNKLILDHGGGLFTAYSHLNDFAVKVNQIVEQTDLLGYVGSTGRVTGPHLHWEIFLNEERINPELLVDLEYAQD
ncbi:MAG: hypothetical protein CMP02_06400 [Woeseiaceae bacterium]|nr:hypothetical protein [Woeseiaceae bacterium]|tara:strand:+ start:1797 stop:2585 length:789 start_codon:yes stop_codon:yes gene_type:complete